MPEYDIKITARAGGSDQATVETYLQHCLATYVPQVQLLTLTVKQRPEPKESREAMH